MYTKQLDNNMHRDNALRRTMYTNSEINTSSTTNETERGQTRNRLNKTAYVNNKQQIRTGKYARQTKTICNQNLSN